MTTVVQRQTDAANQIWFEKTESKTSIGFTEQFLTVVRDCWHVVPAMEGKLTEKSPLLAIETNESLLTIFSPTKGTIIHFSKTAQNFPDKLTTDDVVCVIDSEGAPTKKAKAARPRVQAVPRPQGDIEWEVPPAAGGFVAAAPRDRERRVVDNFVQFAHEMAEEHIVAVDPEPLAPPPIGAADALRREIARRAQELERANNNNNQGQVEF